MRVIKIAGIALVALLVLVVAVAAVGLWWVQSRDMSGLATWAVKKQGYDVAFDGPVHVKLWPMGHVAVGKVVVTGGNDKPMFTTDGAQVAWQWGGGLTPWNGLQVTEVRAKNPTVTLLRDKDGVANWETYVSPHEAAKKPAKTTGNSGFPLGMLAATKLDIENLNASYNDAVSGQKVTVRALNLSAATSGTEAVTKLDGLVNDQKIVGNLQVNIADLADVPLQAKLNGAGLVIAMDGRVHEQKSFAGLVNVQTDNLKQTLAALLGKAPDQAPAEAFRLGGDVDVGAEKISLRNFSTRLGELLQASGDAVINMGDKPSASGNVRVQGSNLRQLAELGTGMPQASLPAVPFNLTTQLAGQDAIELKGLTASVGTLLTASGTVKMVPQSGKQPDVDASLTLNVPNLQTLTKATGQGESYPAKALNMQGTVKGRSGTYDVRGLVADIEDVAKLTGDVKVTVAEQPEVDGALKIEGANIKAAAAGFGVAADTLPTSAFKVQASISGKGTLKADDLVVDLPQLLQATGKVAVTLGSPLNVVASLDVTKANLTALGYCAAEAPPAQTGAPTAEAPASNANAAPWSDDKINVSVLQSIAFDVTLNAKGIDCARLPMESLMVESTNTPSQLDVKNVAVTLKDGGSAKLDGRLEHAGTPALVLNMTTSKLRIETLVPVLATKGVELPLNTTAQFTSRGETSRQLVENLDGTLNLSATEGKIPYTNMLGTASNLAQMIQGTSSTTPDNGNGTVDSLKARYTVRQGVASTDELTVATGNGAMTLVGEGTIDLPNWVLDYKLTPSLSAGSNALAIPIVMKGPLTAPKIGADPAYIAKLSTRLGGELLKGVLGKDAGKAVGGVLGGVINGQGVNKEGIGTLLNSFGKKTSDTTATSGTTTKATVQDLFKAFSK